MTDIDWSEAPEWANVRLVHVRDSATACWAEAYKEDAKAALDDANSSEFELIAKRWVVLATRPATQPASWNGEGLPPVGTVCEYNAHGERDSGKELWCQVQVKYLSAWVIVFECTKAPKGHEESVGVELFGDISPKLENRFRPIRTPEQIAADEREAAVNRIYDILEGSKRPDLMSTCRALYDAGLRFKDDAQ
jgi:hypothetical protein